MTLKSVFKPYIRNENHLVYWKIYLKSSQFLKLVKVSEPVL